MGVERPDQLRPHAADRITEPPLRVYVVATTDQGTQAAVKAARSSALVSSQRSRWSFRKPFLTVSRWIGRPYQSRSRLPGFENWPRTWGLICHFGCASAGLAISGSSR